MELVVLAMVAVGGMGLLLAGFLAFSGLRQGPLPPVPEELLASTPGPEAGGLAALSGESRGYWTMFLGRYTTRGGVAGRMAPHPNLLEYEGEYRWPALTHNREGEVRWTWDGRSGKLRLQGTFAEIWVGAAPLARADLKTGALVGPQGEDLGLLDRARSHRGPEGSVYCPLRLGGVALMLCTWRSRSHPPALAGPTDRLPPGLEGVAAGLVALRAAVLDTPRRGGA